MDLYEMKRKELQSLCKKHGVPANLRNSEMADRLTSLLSEGENPTEGVGKNLEKSKRGIDSEVEIKKVKKVKFSPEAENQTFYFVGTDNDSDSGCEYNPKKKKVGKGKSTAVKQVQVFENSEGIQLSVDIFGSPVRVTRSRAQNAVKGGADAVFSPLPGKKKVRRTCVKNVDVCDKPPVEVEAVNERADGNAEDARLSGGVIRRQLRSRVVVNEDGNAGNAKLSGGVSRRQLRSRVVVSEDVGNSLALRKNIVPRGSKKTKANEGSDGDLLPSETYADNVLAGKGVKPEKVQKQSKGKVTKVENTSILSEKSGKIDIGVRLTRSRAQVEAKSSEVKSRTGILKVQEEGEGILQLEETTKGLGKKYLRQTSAAPLKKSVEGENLPGAAVESGKPIRRSKRNLARDTDSVSGQLAETKVAGRRKKPKIVGLASVQEEHKDVPQLEEPSEIPNISSSRRKFPVVQKVKELENVGTRNQSRASKVELSVETIEQSVVLQPNVPLRRSIRKTTLFSSDTPDDRELRIHEAAGTVKQSKASGQEECKEVTNHEEPSKSPSMNTSRGKLPVVHKGKEQEKGDARKRPRNTNLERASKVEQSVKIIEESVVILPNGPLRRSRRRTTLFSSDGPHDRELRISEAAGTVKQSRESVAEKHSIVTKPLTRSSRNDCKKIETEASDGMGEISKGVKKNASVKQTRESTLEKESSCTVNESSNRTPQRRSPRNVSKTAPTRLTGISSGKNKKGKSRIPIIAEEVLFAKINPPLEEKSNLDVGLEVLEAAGNENDIDSTSSKDIVEKSSKRRKGSSKKSELLNRGDVDEQSCPSLNRGDTGCDNAIGQNSEEFQDKLTYITPQPDCEGERSNLLNLGEGPETDESLTAKTTDQRSDVVDDQLSDSSKLGDSADQHLVQLHDSGTVQPVLVEPVIEYHLTKIDENKESNRNTEKSAEVREEISAVSPCDGKEIVQVDHSCPSLNKSDTGHETTVEHNAVESPDKLNKLVYSRFNTLGDGQSPTDQPDCEGECSNLLDLKVGRETDDSLANMTTNQTSAVVDDQLTDGTKASDTEDQNLVQLDVRGIDQPVPVEPVLEGHLTENVDNEDSDRNSEKSAEVLGEINVVSPCDGKEIVQRDHFCPSLNRGDTVHDTGVEQNPVEGADKFSNVVSSRFTCLDDGQAPIYQPVCEGERSNLLNLKEGPETDDSFTDMKTNQTRAVVDDQLTGSTKASDTEDQNVQLDASEIDQPVLVEPVLEGRLTENVDDEESDRNSKKPAEVLGEINAVSPCDGKEIVQGDHSCPSLNRVDTGQDTAVEQNPVEGADNISYVVSSTFTCLDDGQAPIYQPVCEGESSNLLDLKDSSSYVSEVPEEATSSGKADILCGQERTDGVEENESFIALDMGQTVPSVIENVANEGIERNSELDDGVPEDQNSMQLDASGTDQPSLVDPVFEDHLTKLVENKESGRNSEKSSDRTEFVQVDAGSIKAAETSAETDGGISDTAVTSSRSSLAEQDGILFEAQSTIVGQSNIKHMGMKDSCSYATDVPDEATSPGKADILCGLKKMGVMPEEYESFTALDDQTAPSVTEEAANEGFERNSKLDGGVPEDQKSVQLGASGHLTEVVENKESDRDTKKSAEDVEEISACLPCDKETSTETVGDIHQGGIVPCDETPSRSSLVKQGPQAGNQFEINNVEEKEMTHEDRGNDSLDVNPLFQENAVALENKADLVMDAMIVDKNATSRENAEGLSVVQKDDRAIEVQDKSEIFTHWEMSTIFGDAERDASEKSDKPVKGCLKATQCENAMDVVTKVFEQCHQRFSEEQLCGHEQDDASVIIQEYLDYRKRTDKNFVVENFNVGNHKAIFTEGCRTGDSDYVEDKVRYAGVAEDRACAMAGDTMEMQQPENRDLDFPMLECDKFGMAEKLSGMKEDDEGLNAGTDDFCNVLGGDLKERDLPTQEGYEFGMSERVSSAKVGEAPTASIDVFGEENCTRTYQETEVELDLHKFKDMEISSDDTKQSTEHKSSLELSGASPEFNSFGLKELFSDDKIDGFRKSDPEMSQVVNSMIDDGEDVPQVAAGQHTGHEHNLEDVMELKSTQETHVHCHVANFTSYGDNKRDEFQNLDAGLYRPNLVSEDVKEGTENVLVIPQYLSEQCGDHGQKMAAEVLKSTHPDVESTKVSVENTDVDQCPTSGNSVLRQEILESPRKRSGEADSDKSISVSSAARWDNKKDSLIPRTSKTLVNILDMKENFRSTKSDQVSDSAVKTLQPRRALEDLGKK